MIRILDKRRVSEHRLRAKVKAVLFPCSIYARR